MEKYIIATDSGADLNSCLVEKYDIKVIPLVFYLDGRNYELNTKETEDFIKTVYSKLREGSMITTSQVNPSRFVEFFEEYLKEGKDVFYLAFSSALSGTYQSACIAKDELMEKYPERKIIVVDTLCASLGQGLLVTEVCKLKENGLSIEEVEKFVNENRLKMVHYFTVDDLMFLKRGGRLSASAAFLGTMLQLKPILHVNDEGKLVPIGKVPGRRNSLKTLVKRMRINFTDWSDKTVYISHGDCMDDINFVLDCMKNEKITPKELVINNVGAVIGAHSGPGTVAIFFFSENRK